MSAHDWLFVIGVVLLGAVVSSFWYYVRQIAEDVRSISLHTRRTEGWTEHILDLQLEIPIKGLKSEGSSS